jgi:hypothetical protein
MPNYCIFVNVKYAFLADNYKYGINWWCLFVLQIPLSTVISGLYLLILKGMRLEKCKI